MKAGKVGTNGTGALTLQEWINEVGVASVAKLLRVEPSAVRHWRRGHCLPGSKLMYRIHHFSNGRVAYDEMIETFHAPKSQAK